MVPYCLCFFYFFRLKNYDKVVIVSSEKEWINAKGKNWFFLYRLFFVKVKTHRIGQHLFYWVTCWTYKLRFTDSHVGLPWRWIYTTHLIVFSWSGTRFYNMTSDAIVPKQILADFAYLLGFNPYPLLLFYNIFGSLYCSCSTLNSWL